MKKVGIIGFGTMGRGIALSCAKYNYEVIVFDNSNESLKNGFKILEREIETSILKEKISKDEGEKIFSKIKIGNSLNDFLNCEIVIEAIIEDLSLKQQLFFQLEKIVSQDTILLSNTSSISISEIAFSSMFSNRIAGLHFFNPAFFMKLVEVIKGEKTSFETIETIINFAKSIGKIPVSAKDSPGFIVNKIARPFYLESLKILEEKISTVEEIDKIVKLEGGFKMGPFELMDLIGIDINYAVSKSVYEQSNFEERFRPNEIQKRKVEKNELGRKTKIGFYNY